MLRVNPGHYRDTFCRTVFDVRRIRNYTTGTVRHALSWAFELHGPAEHLYGGYATKAAAAAAARRMILDRVDQKAASCAS